jgi:hypothetical protein
LKEYLLTKEELLKKYPHLKKFITSEEKSMKSKKGLDRFSN